MTTPPRDFEKEAGELMARIVYRWGVPQLRLDWLKDKAEITRLLRCEAACKEIAAATNVHSHDVADHSAQVRHLADTAREALKGT